MKAGLEAKVGAFVIICFVLIGFMSLKAGSFSIGGHKGMEIKAELSNASGLTPDSAVMFNGVEVGKVTDVRLVNGKPVITMVIDKQYEIPSNVILAVRSSGFLGEKYAELQMKTNELAGALKQDDVIRESASSTDFDELGNQLGDIAGDVKEITSALKEVLATAEAKENMKMTLENARYTTDMLRDILAQNEMRVNAIMRNVESLTGSLNNLAVSNQQNMNDIIANIRLITEDLRMQTPAIAENLRNVTGDIDDIVGGNKTDINDTIKNLRAVTAKLETTVDNMNDITGQIKSGEGTVGKLIYDNNTIDNVNETLTSLKNTVGKLDKMQVYLSFEGQHNFEESENKGYFRLKLVPNEKRYYLLGLESHPNGRDTTEKFTQKIYNGGNPAGGDGYWVDVEGEKTVNKDELTFTAMYAHRFFDNFYFRIGLMESEFGVGADFYPISKNKNFELKLDVYDFPDEDEDRNVNVKAYARYKFFENFFITGGVDNIANSDTRTLFLGGGVEFKDDDLKYLLGSIPSF